jgi:hypothetical protein
VPPAAAVTHPVTPPPAAAAPAIKPSPQAIDALKANLKAHPELMGQFDQKYGPGAAAKALGQ